MLALIPAALHVVQVLPAPKPSGSACPLCGAVSSRVRGHYSRILADLPWQGRGVIVRPMRFRCGRAGCSRQVFAERLPEVAQPRTRRTARLGDIQRRIGLALGGEPGSRPAVRLVMPMSGDTLLRLVRASELVPYPSPRTVGVDEWAWRRGLRYGTILRGLERGPVVGLLPACGTGTVAAWLKRHPSVAVIARDRASVFAEPMRQGAAGASEIADRRHLLRNLGDALRAAAGRHRAAVTAAAKADAMAATETALPAPAAADTRLVALRRSRRTARRGRHAEVRPLRDAGMPPRPIVPRVGMSQRSVEPEHRRLPVASLADSFRPCLERRWQEGGRDAAALWREVKAQGFTGSPDTVRRWAGPCRGPRVPVPDQTGCRPRAEAPARAVSAALRVAARPGAGSADSGRASLHGPSRRGGPEARRGRRASTAVCRRDPGPRRR